MMNFLPPLNALPVFEASARHLSFQQAARELHVTPSAVSHQIKLLETYLNKQLFFRLDKRVELTADGRRYLQMVQPALKAIGKVSAELMSKKESPVLTISAAPVLATRWIMPRIYKFQEANADLEVRIHASTDLVDFKKSEVDVGIRHGNPPFPNLEYHKIFQERLTPVCSMKLLSGRELKSPRDLLHFPLLQGCTRPREWVDWLQVFNLEKQGISKGPTFQSRAQALEAAVLGLGIVLTDKRLVRQELEQGTLIVPLKEEVDNVSAFYLVYPESEKQSLKIRLFRKWILAEAANEESELLN